MIVKETAFEFLPPHPVMDGGLDMIPMPPKVVPPSGGLNTETSAVPGFAMSIAVMAAISSWLLVKVVTRNEPFQFTTES